MSFQNNAFQSNAFQMMKASNSVVDTHDGGEKKRLYVPEYHFKPKQKKKVINDLSKLNEIINIEPEKIENIREKIIAINTDKIAEELTAISSNSLYSIDVKLAQLKALYEQEESDLMLLAMMSTIH